MTKNLFCSNLSIMFWNIDGMYTRLEGDRKCKIETEELSNNLYKNDIICLAETHCSFSDSPNLTGYKIVHNIRPKHPRATKHSGGLAICVKIGIIQGVTFIKTTNSEFMWLKLCKHFFNLDKDLYIALVYICPVSSAVGKRSEDNIFELLENDIAKYCQLGDYLLCGDFNATTNTDHDFCTSSIIDDFISTPPNTVHDQHLPRNNLDSSPVDSNGKLLLELCKSSSLRMLNGRCLGDMLGCNTCYSNNGAPSLIDYMLCNQSFFFSNIHTFVVGDPNNNSIHCTLNLTIKTKPYRKTVEYTSDDLLPLKPNFKWKEGDNSRFSLAFLNTEVQLDISNLLGSLSGNQVALSADSTVEKFNEIIIKAAHKAGLSQTRKSANSAKKQIPKQKNKIWYDYECKNLKDKIAMLGKLIRKYPYALNLIYDFKHVRKLYKSTLKKKRKTFINKTLNSLETLQNSNPKKCWDLFKNLKEYDKQVKSNPIPPSKWVTFQWPHE